MVRIEVRDIVVLVDPRDQELGTLDKVQAHTGCGVLHRAISVFLTDRRGRILTQKRHPNKLVWGGFWSNSCCTHPYVGESTLDCAMRRVQEELGLSVALEFHFKLQYFASYSDEFAENELVSVYTGMAHGSPNVDTDEVSELRWIEPDILTQELATVPNKYTPWCLWEWKELQSRNIL